MFILQKQNFKEISYAFIAKLDFGETQSIHFQFLHFLLADVKECQVILFCWQIQTAFG